MSLSFWNFYHLFTGTIFSQWLQMWAIDFVASQFHSFIQSLLTYSYILHAQLKHIKSILFCVKKKSCILDNVYRSKSPILIFCLSRLKTTSRHVFFVSIGQKQIPFVIILIFFLLHFNLSNTPIQNLNCFKLLGRYYNEAISFFTTAS